MQWLGRCRLLWWLWLWLAMAMPLTAAPSQGAPFQNFELQPPAAQGAVSQSDAVCVLRFALDTPFPPHIIIEPQSKHGLNVRMLQALAAEVGCQVHFVKSPWARALKLLQQGDIDVISQLSYNQARGEDIYFIGPHHQERMWLIADPTKLPTLQQLSDVRQWPESTLLAMLNGGYFGETFRLLKADARFNRHLLPILSNLDKLSLLESGRVQAVLEEEFAWRWRVRQQATPYQMLLLVHDNPVYFGFSRRSVSPERAAALVTAWQRLYQQGVLQQIRQHYLPSAAVVGLKTSSSPALNNNLQQPLSPIPTPHPYL